MGAIVLDLYSCFTVMAVMSQLAVHKLGHAGPRKHSRAPPCVSSSTALFDVVIWRVRHIRTLVSTCHVRLGHDL